MKRVSIDIPGKSRSTVSGLWLRPKEAQYVFVMAHGAGAGMEHSFMAQFSKALADKGVATLRFNFPYWEAGKRRPDHRTKLIPCVRAAIEKAKKLAPDLPLFCGGKSMGGRMTSQALAEAEDSHIAGLIFIGFPLHPPKKEGVERAEHLYNVKVPMLFLQGTRDALADMELMKGVIKGLKKKANLKIIDGADHSFGVLKRSGRTDDEARGEMVDSIYKFCAKTVR